MRKLLKEFGKKIYFKEYWFIYVLYIFGVGFLSVCGCVGLFSSCTLNITQAHTSGYADDLIDTKNEQEVDPTLSIPIKAV